MNSYKFKLMGIRYYTMYRLGMKSAFSQTTILEQECLMKYASNKKRLVEIGVYQGANTKRFRQVMDEQGTLLAIDPFERSFGGLLGFGWIRRIAHREVNNVRRGKVIWIETLGCQATSDPAVQPYLPVDFIFIDGDHSWEGIRGDWNAWSDNVGKGGIVALHDSINVGQVGSERFTQEVIIKDVRFELLEIVDTLTVLQKH